MLLFKLNIFNSISNPKNLFVTEYISAEIVNGIFKGNMKNRELEKYGYKIDFKIKDYYLSYVTGETMVGNYNAIITYRNLKRVKIKDTFFL